MLEMAVQRLEKQRLANFTGICGSAHSLPFGDAAFDETARVLRSGGRFSSTEAAGDPDRVKQSELDKLAALAGLAKGESWSDLLVQTFNYKKPVTRAA